MLQGVPNKRSVLVLKSFDPMASTTLMCTGFEALANQKTGEREHRPSIRVRSQSGTEHVHYSLTYEGFPDEFQVQAEKNKETPEGRKRGLQRLKEFMKSENLPPLKDDVVLLATLRNCKYNLKNAETKLKKLMSIRQKVGGMLKEAGMETIERVVDDMGFGFLPYRDKRGSAIFYTRPYGVNLDRYSVGDVALVLVAGVLFTLSFPITSVAGFAYFGECKSPSQYLFYSIIKEYRSWVFSVLSLPIRVARMEVLNENNICKCFYRVLQKVISKKIMSRVTLHGSENEQFFEMYDPNFLPEEFGGNAGPISNEAYKQKFMDFMRDLMDEDC